MKPILPEIRMLKEKKLLGMSARMSLVDNKTHALFSTFMPRKKEIKNPVTSNVYDLRLYDSDYFLSFDPNKIFEKWAAMEVSNDVQFPEGMRSMQLMGGKYAVFTYKSNTGMAIFEYIFRVWLPASEYELDDRPHFEIFGELAQQKDPNATEEIWIPIK